MTVVDEAVAPPPSAAPDVPVEADPDQPVRVPRLTLTALAGAVVVLVMVQRWGMLTHDTRLDLLLDPGGFLSATWNLWDPTADMGRIQNQAAGYLFPMGPFMLLGHLLHLPPWVVERAWIALLLVVALWGMARLLDELGVGSVPARLVGALSYALSPLFVTRVGNMSVFVQGAAFLPFMLLALVVGSRRGSPRRAAALSGVAVLCMGGVNAVVVGAALIPGAIWLLTRERGPRRAALVRWWALAVVLATAWWAVPLTYQARYGIDFLPFTERAGTTTTFTPPFEVLRGVADWLSYARLQGPPLMAGYIETTAGLVIAGGALVVAVGLYGLAQRRLPEARFFVLTFLVGATLVGAGYGGALGNPLGPEVVSLLDGPLGLFRNVYKFAPVVLLPVAVGLVAGIDALAAALRHRRPSLAGAVPVAMAALVLLGAWPLLGGDLLHHRAFEQVPEWWDDAKGYLQDQPGRTLIVPGLPLSSARWGYPAEEPLEWDNDAPFAVRQIAPLGSAGATRVLDTVEATIEAGGSPLLAEYLARSGFSTVLVRNDADWRSSGAPSPATVTTAARASGLVLVASFGPPESVSAQPGAGDLTIHPIEIYEVPGASSVAEVTTTPVAEAAVVAGDAGSLLKLGGSTLEDRSVVLSSDLVDGDPVPPLWVLTDGNRRTYTSFGLNRRNRSYTMTADEPSPAGGSVSAGFLPTDRVEDQTVAVRSGITEVTATSYGSWIVPVPEVGAPQAIDGEPETAWAAAAELDPETQSIRLELDRPVDPGEIGVRLLADGPWRPMITALEVTSEAGSVITEVEPGEDEQPVAVAPGETSWIEVRLAEVEVDERTTAGPGIREISVPGTNPDQRLAVPSPPEAAFEDPSSPIYVFERVRADPHSFLRRDEEQELRRTWDQPVATTVRPEVRVSAVGGEALTELLGSSALHGVSASSTIADLPGFGPPNLIDGDPRTTWIAGADPAGTPADTSLGPDGSSTSAAGWVPSNGSDPNPTVVFEWAETQTFDRLSVGAVEEYASPESVKVVTDRGDERSASVDSDGVARFEPVSANRIEVTFPTIGRHVVKEPDGTLTERPLALSDLSVPGAPGVGVAQDDVAVSVPCGRGPSIIVDGRRYDLAVESDRGAAAAMVTVPAVVCGPSTIDLAAGSHTLDTTRSDASPYVVAMVTLPPTDATLTPFERRDVTVESWAAQDRSVSVGPGAESYVVVDENRNAGWRATLDGESLRPVTIDGWKQGFVVPAGDGGDIRLTYTPVTGYRLALVLGGLLVLGLLVMLLVRPRRADPPPSGAGREPMWLLVVVALGAGVALGGPLVVLLVPLVLAARWRPGVPAAVAGGSFALAAVVVATSPASNPGSASGAFGWLATLLSVAALLAVTSTLFAGSEATPMSPEPDEVRNRQRGAGASDPTGGPP